MTHALFAFWFGIKDTDLGNWSNLASVVGIVPLIAALATIGLSYKHRQCDVPWCPRIERHPVDRTTWKVCSHHHTVEAHKALQKRHAEKHPDRMVTGQTV